MRSPCMRTCTHTAILTVTQARGAHTAEHLTHTLTSALTEDLYVRVIYVVTHTQKIWSQVRKAVVEFLKGL